MDSPPHENPSPARFPLTTEKLPLQNLAYSSVPYDEIRVMATVVTDGRII